MSHAREHSHSFTATVEKKPHSVAEIMVEIPAETLMEHRAMALKEIGRDAQIDGFRKGHVPEKVLLERVGEMAILTEAAEITIRHTYPHVLEEHDLDPIGAPEITITALAPGNPLKFKAVVALIPSVKLPDYKKIAQEKNKEKQNIAVTDKDVEDQVERIQRQKLAYDRIQEKAKARKETEDAGLPLPEETEEDYSKLPLPELTDEYVKTLGNFETVEQFKNELRTHLQSEKEQEAQGKRRADLTDAIIEKTEIDLPQILIDSELNQMTAEMEGDIKRAGLSLEDYLSHVKKTREDLVKEWTPIAEKRAKLQLILNEIAKVENVTPDQEKVSQEVAHLVEHFKGADVERVLIYVETTMRNDAVLSMLESIGDAK